MTNYKLQQALELSKNIKDLELIIKNCKTQSCTWIEFTFGNGSNRANVCNDENIIKLARDLILLENEKKLAELKRQFEEL